MKQLISIIVPVYKVEKYLECCLDSLCKQSMPEIEIILIDDASPDRCGEICDAYAAKDTRFRVVHHPTNKGVSAVRNQGIRLASCDYIMFVDSDDWVADDLCKEAYQCTMQNNADLVMFNYQIVIDGKTKNPVPVATVPEGHITRDEAIDLLFTKIKNYPCNKLYRKELFNGVLYPEGCYYEDIATTHNIVWNASNIYCMDKVLYFYRRRPGSTTMDGTKSGDWLKMRILQLKELWYKGCRAEQYLIFLNNFGMWYCIRHRKNPADPNYTFFANILCKNHSFPKGFTWKRKILFLLLKYCPPCFELVCTLFSKK